MRSLKIIIILTLFLSIDSLWTASGRFIQNPSIITHITQIISDNANKQYIQDVDIQTISNNLNSRFGTFWNIITLDPWLDVLGNGVVFGYAFNDNWYWKSASPGAVSKVSWIIWKDYNCVVSKLFTFDLQSYSFSNKFSGSMSSATQVISNTTLRNKVLLNEANPNIWDNMVRLYDQMNSLFEGSYSIVGVEYNNDIWVRGKFCSYSQSQIQSNYASFIFTTQGINYYVLAIGMSPLYKSTVGSVKPVAPYMPSCLRPPSLTNLPKCR